MIGSVEKNGNDGLLEVGGKDGDIGVGRGGEKSIKFAMSGCHDTTLAAVLSSFGAFEGEEWPPYTSQIAFELFTKTSPAREDIATGRTSIDETRRTEAVKNQKQSLWSSILGRVKTGSMPAPEGMARKPMSELSAQEKRKLDGYYVRIRYNDRPMTIPGCKLAGNHLEGDESFCTLVKPSTRNV